MPAETVSDNVETLINLALAEDFGSGDVTSTYFVPEHLTARAILTPRKKGVLSGVNVAAEVFRKVDPTLKVEVYLHDGEAVAPGAVVMLIEGSARSILGAERTALNFIQRLSGVATLTRQYVKAVSHTSARILDTRKTTPGYRLLEKAAVLHGGGTNHRMGLYDRAMVKDNHLMTDGNTEHLQECINRLRQEKPGVEIQLEADTLEQVGNFLKLEGVDHILLDNMTPEMLKQAVAMRGGRTTPPAGSQRRRSSGYGSRHCGIRRGLRLRRLRDPLGPLPGPGAGFQRRITPHRSTRHGLVQFQRRIPQRPAAQKGPGGKSL
ncbi:carboxylating nicotinate-nucleotide diphosphorylase [Akkermansia muciniphila]|uniref:carboxylating nicotinate-nucleotide diphosphorylase n=1 Tax=Akkermansia muciniphila TaxID=239935 RepID=UPI001C064321|nr:carboxylating nicotinate-nucleotide diphosphorylase [Akkermansia muciniphila]QWP40522.1 carboxylating nicotinate-nucleotide diphosphorylase [Akkermansia muciniphila]